MAITTPKTITCKVNHPDNCVEFTCIFTIYPPDKECGIFSGHIEIDDVFGMKYEEQEKYYDQLLQQIDDHLEYESTQESDYIENWDRD